MGFSPLKMFCFRGCFSEHHFLPRFLHCLPYSLCSQGTTERYSGGEHKATILWVKLPADNLMARNYLFYPENRKLILGSGIFV